MIIDIKHLKDQCLKLLKASLGYIKNQSIEGAFPPEEGFIPNPMTTAEVVSVLIETNYWNIDNKIITKAVNHLKKWQCKEGFWTDPNEIEQPWDVSSTSWAIWALATSGISINSSEIKRARKWLEIHFLPDGGLPTNTRGEKSNTYATSYALRAFNKVNDRIHAEKCIKFISSVQNKNGGWGLFSNEQSEATLTSYVLHGLLDGGVDINSKLFQLGVGWLIKDRKYNGIWTSWLGEEFSVEGTAFSLYIISRIGYVVNIDIRPSLKFLINKLKDGSIWSINGKNKIWVTISVLLASKSILSQLDRIN